MESTILTSSPLLLLWKLLPKRTTRTSTSLLFLVATFARLPQPPASRTPKPSPSPPRPPSKQITNHSLCGAWLPAKANSAPRSFCVNDTVTLTLHHQQKDCIHHHERNPGKD